jgi:hypothetical protein
MKFPTTMDDDDNNHEARRAITEGLLTYCKLDTASMIMIWRHWAEKSRV